MDFKKELIFIKRIAPAPKFLILQYNPKPQCEVKLAKKINDLIDTLEARQPSLADVTKKARAKLHKEWTNFETGYAFIYSHNIFYQKRNIGL